MPGTARALGAPCREPMGAADEAALFVSAGPHARPKTP
ncbi:MAG: hypothetical protein RJA99_2235 [Pseudomonadota bacterium]|jgi:hypothetical protein